MKCEDIAIHYRGQLNSDLSLTSYMLFPHYLKTHTWGIS